MGCGASNEASEGSDMSMSDLESIISGLDRTTSNLSNGSFTHRTPAEQPAHYADGLDSIEGSICSVSEEGAPLALPAALSNPGTSTDSTTNGHSASNINDAPARYLVRCQKAHGFTWSNDLSKHTNIEWFLEYPAQLPIELLPQVFQVSNRDWYVVDRAAMALLHVANPPSEALPGGQPWAAILNTTGGTLSYWVGPRIRPEDPLYSSMRSTSRRSLSDSAIREMSADEDALPSGLLSMYALTVQTLLRQLEKERARKKQKKVKRKNWEKLDRNSRVKVPEQHPSERILSQGVGGVAAAPQSRNPLAAPAHNASQPTKSAHDNDSSSRTQPRRRSKASSRDSRRPAVAKEASVPSVNFMKMDV